ncbi:Protein CBG01729 [Caenorhabditis briggsae]|uniref:Protein CBG01729 n=1 Tax=Caenorhabditis briggsae TaxID=6238 RepID=A8WQZ5_CAEBR|nr:Protein CBG01729 [Caenorhabditis briggsae]CAP22903.2 Protein CBG01729 [Caenorhabditis briggsae]
MKPHLCDQPMNLTRRACCQLVLFLNDTERKPPIYLVEPIEESEDHLTFFIGIFMLMIIALAFSIGLSKMTKPKVSISRYNNSNSSYDILMWLSSNPTNRSSMLLLLRSMCRTPATPDSSVSVVSSNIPLLPSYQRASQSTSANTPPPPYSATSSLVA